MTRTEAPATSERSSCRGIMPSKKACRSAASRVCGEAGVAGGVWPPAGRAVASDFFDGIGLGSCAGPGAGSKEKNRVKSRIMQAARRATANAGQFGLRRKFPLSKWNGRYERGGVKVKNRPAAEPVFKVRLRVGALVLAKFEERQQGCRTPKRKLRG